jgi:hypothetical protein
MNNQNEGDNKLITAVQKTSKDKSKKILDFSDLKTMKEEKKTSKVIPKVKNENKKLTNVKAKTSLLSQSEKKIFFKFNSKRKKEGLKSVDEISYDSYLNFKNSLSLMIGKIAKLDYDVFEAIVKKYKIKSV